MAMTFANPNLVTLGGVALTDESRQPLNEERDERSVTVDLASGKKKKFVKGVQRRWTISWENVAADAAQTVDGLGGRDEIRAIAEGAGFIPFAITDGRNPTESYTVMVESYDEETLMRRDFDGGFRYRVSINVVEQG